MDEVNLDFRVQNFLTAYISLDSIFILVNMACLFRCTEKYLQGKSPPEKAPEKIAPQENCPPENCLPENCLRKIVLLDFFCFQYYLTVAHFQTFYSH